MYSRTWFWVVLAAVTILLAVSDARAGAHPHPERTVLSGSPTDQFYIEDAAVMLLIDPCPEYGTAPPRDVRRERAQCWIFHAFPEAERATALAVAELESDWRPEVCFNWHTKEDWQCQPPNALRGDWGRATGLFQHRYKLWDDRAENTMSQLGLVGFGDRLDIWNGWHNTLVAAWLAGWRGWSHWDACAESNAGDGRPHPRERNCGRGRWLR